MVAPAGTLVWRPEHAPRRSSSCASRTPAPPRRATPGVSSTDSGRSDRARLPSRQPPAARPTHEPDQGRSGATVADSGHRMGPAGRSTSSSRAARSSCRSWASATSRWASSATASSPTRSAPAPSSTPTTRRSASPRSPSTSSSPPGLTAPFVPIFTSLRRRDEPAAPTTFGRTVMTGAVGVDGRPRCCIVRRARRGWPTRRRPGLRSGDPGPVRRAAADQLPRPGPVRRVHRLGEILVANRRFLSYALAPILYTAGIVARDRAVRRHGSGSTPRPGARWPAPPPISASGPSASSGPRSGSGRRSRSGRRRSASSSG